MRTLHDMKADRGGHCKRCGIDIMSPDQQDHTFCNNCWDAMMAHPYEEWRDMEGEVGWEYCDYPKEHAIHVVRSN